MEKGAIEWQESRIGRTVTTNNQQPMIVTLKHVGLSWWWHQNECEIHCSDGRKVDPEKEAGQSVEIHETPEGIEARYFWCGTGTGKVEDEGLRRILIPRKEYTKVIHTGKEPQRPGAEIETFVRGEMGW